tara:strand:+ start:694 stop:993 length:300 start_codon:yes stop_codon:yes gene_type:complete
MKDTIAVHQFRDEMIKDRYGFSYGGATALYEYLMDLEEDTGIEMEFDPIAFTCEWTEYNNLQEVLEGYSIDYVKNIEDLRDQTTVIEVEGTQRIIIHEF